MASIKLSSLFLLTLFAFSVLNIILLAKITAINNNSQSVSDVTTTTTTTTTPATPAITTSRRRIMVKEEEEVEEAKYNFTTAICVVVKDAEPYFEEWVEYHLEGMKFDAIYIYDDSLTFELNHWYQNTRNDKTFSKVHVIHYNRTLDIENDLVEDKIIQNFVYEDCVSLFGLSETGPKHDYFAFIDIDEFLVLPGYHSSSNDNNKNNNKNKYSDIRGVLQDYLVPYGGALVVNWVLIGSSNKTVYSPLPVTKRFQYRSNSTHNVIKTIAKATDYIKHRNPHSVKVRDGTNIHTTLSKGNLHKEASGSTGASDHDYPSDVLLLYHYRYTSQKEYLYKRCMRGNVDRGSIWCSRKGNSITSGGPDHIQPFVGDVFDDTPWRFLTDRVPKYKLYDEFKDFH